jgi:hypothetical protein
MMRHGLRGDTEETIQGKMSTEASPARGLPLIALAVGLLLAVRLATLGSLPLWWDEVWTHRCVDGFFQGSILEVCAEDTAAPLHCLTLSAFRAMGVWGSDWALRLPSLLFHLVNGALLLVLAWRLMGRAAAGWALLVFALSPVGLHFAAEARSYAMGAAFVSLGWLAVWGMIADPRRLILWTCVHALAGIAMIHTHYALVAVLIAQGIAVLATGAGRRSWRAVVGIGVSALLIALAFLPWLITIQGFDRTFAHRTLSWIPTPMPWDPLRALGQEVLLGEWGPVTRLWVWLPATVLLIALLLRDAPRSALFAAWMALGPALIAMLISWGWFAVYFRPRFTMFCLAGAALWIGGALVRSGPRVRAALIAALLFGAATEFTLRPFGDSPALADVLRSHDAPADLIFADPLHEAPVSHCGGQPINLLFRDWHWALLAHTDRSPIWVLGERGSGGEETREVIEWAFEHLTSLGSTWVEGRPPLTAFIASPDVLDRHLAGPARGALLRRRAEHDLWIPPIGWPGVAGGFNDGDSFHAIEVVGEDRQPARWAQPQAQCWVVPPEAGVWRVTLFMSDPPGGAGIPVIHAAQVSDPRELWETPPLDFITWREEPHRAQFEITVADPHSAPLRIGWRRGGVELVEPGLSGERRVVSVRLDGLAMNQSGSLIP